MDEASTLIASLHSKLRELDHKVLLYRRVMAAEFTKHSDALLRDVAPDVAASVTAAVAEGMGAYPSLVDTVAATATPEDSGTPPSTNPAGEIAREVGRLKEQGKLTPPPPIDVAGAADTDVPRSPHAREAEFLGVFTQGYLPLLDSSDKHERRDGTPVLKATQDAEADRKAELVATNLSVSYSPPSRKPKPRRRNTDDSGSMSDPENPVRRSALRRSSISGKVNGLRRVRFEFAGKEFPTTSSPSMAETKMMPSALDAMSNEADEGGEEQVEIEQVEDVHEETASRRISSSQALRMLSRGPVEDDGTKWDEVRAPADGSASVSIDDAAAALSDEEDFISIAPRRMSPQSPNGASPIAIPGPVSPSTSPHASQLHEDVSKVSMAEAKEEGHILSEMTPLAPMHSTRGVRTNNTTSPAMPIDISGANPSNTLTSPSPTKLPTPITTQPTRQPLGTPTTLATAAAPPSPTSIPHPDSDSDYEDDFFAFDDAPPSTRTRRAKPPRAQSPNSTSSSSSTPASPEPPVPVALSAYAKSPAQAIISRAPSAPESGDGDADAGRGAGAGADIPYAPAIGSSLRNSYHPFAEPIVSPAVHEAARRMGEVSSFVGSLRDGMMSEGARGASWGGSAGGWVDGGGARSFSERLAMEDWAEGRGKGGE
ncbi:hypothetical protein GMDG_07376 [Pseudogymnoascus destructans 20631-21]|uniref:Uncharacterized protein n=1 Tax=Pseudogymnoascus destructans (strain ATCC MYA-4855 / 20631-21) TaxID=658429 RepID=L8FY21_PSED2|nr:hypothetical protein GMDG_07376 [Pseudogymnoascus destructans 20631-21]